MDLKGFFRKALSKTQQVIQAAFQATIPEEILTELEDRLILADVGPATAADVTEAIRKTRPKTSEEVRLAAKRILIERLANSAVPLMSAAPTVWFLLGTNGSGKTTTAAKLAAYYRRQGMTVALVAADTYRAAAIDQLRVWAARAGTEFFAMQEGSQPAAVVFDALADKKIRTCRLIIVDTAGRLHTRTSLLEELTKMIKSCEKSAPGALSEKLLVLDGTAGLNTLVQARTFHDTIPLTGLIVTKLDASAKAGFLFSINSDLPGVPVKWVGMGESLEDISPFDREAYVEGLIGR